MAVGGGRWVGWGGGGVRGWIDSARLLSALLKVVFFTFSGLMEHPLVGEVLTSKQNDAKCTEDDPVLPEVTVVARRPIFHWHHQWAPVASLPTLIHLFKLLGKNWTPGPFSLCQGPRRCDATKPGWSSTTFKLKLNPREWPLGKPLDQDESQILDRCPSGNQMDGAGKCVSNLQPVLLYQTGRDAVCPLAQRCFLETKKLLFPGQRLQWNQPEKAISRTKLPIKLLGDLLLFNKTYWHCQ